MIKLINVIQILLIMVGLRVFRCYRRIKNRAYTRKSKFKSKGYIKAIPPHKISRFEMGEKKNYDYIVKLVSKDSLQIRHNALESARMLINRSLQDGLGNSYFLRLSAYPHHAFRENKMLGGAHADRLQTGMAHSFGKVIGTAARIKKGKEIFVAMVNEDGIEKAKKALISATSRLPGRCFVEVEKSNNM